MNPIQTIHLSQQAKDQLIKLKRVTKLKHWNVLCRWAFCISLAEPSVPPTARIPADSSVEMTWKVFAGKHSEVYLALLIQRCKKDGLGLDDETVGAQFRLHLHRGISYLAGDRKLTNIVSLLEPISCSKS